MQKYRALRFEPQLRLERPAQGGQKETEQPGHSASLGDSIMSAIRIRSSVHNRLDIVGMHHEGSKVIHLR
jgi:hypothetical protein